MEYFSYANQLNDTFGYLTYGDQWEYYFQPRMDYLNRKIFTETKVLVNYHPIYLRVKKNSIYKESFDRFLNHIRDFGLYQRWTKGAFTEAIYYKLKSKWNIEESYTKFEFANKIECQGIPKIRPINVFYLKYCILLYFVGLIISTIAFKLELAFQTYHWKFSI